MAPQTDCLSPIGELLIRKGLKNVLGDLKPDFYAPPVTRMPAVHAGNPFVVECGIVYGGDLPKDQEIQILRFANRVPLLYMQGSCVITEAIQAIDWRRYGLQQHGNSIPIGPAVVLVHVASTKIPFTSESKEAIASVPELKSEIEKALRDAARKLHTHLSKSVRRAKTREKFDIVQKVLPAIANKAAAILEKPVPPIDAIVTKIMDIVWVDDRVEYSEGRHKITIDVYNYTNKSKKFNLYAVVPKGTLVEKTIKPKPNLIKDGCKLEWKLKGIKPVSNIKIYFELKGLDKDEYDENELYASGIDPVKIVGVQPLPGDWDLEGMPVISEEDIFKAELEEEKGEEYAENTTD
jgi:DNA topoisomerase-6 subunit B